VLERAPEKFFTFQAKALVKSKPTRWLLRDIYISFSTDSDNEVQYSKHESFRGKKHTYKFNVDHIFNPLKPEVHLSSIKNSLLT
jgi:hypothetical protein